MPHERQRYLEDLLKKELRWAPSIAVLGMRQVGKTTLIQRFSKAFHSFDSPRTIANFEKSSEEILSQGPFPLGLDEVQKFPPLFDALKLQVDIKKIPGRYLLTGSARFSSRKNIRESLTGRISTLELLPFTLAEAHGKPLSLLLENIQKWNGEKALSVLAKNIWAKDADLKQALRLGGLPGICFKRDEQVREKLFKNHLETLFGRDIQFIYETTLGINTLMDLYSLLCQSQGEPIRYSLLARQIGSTGPTVARVIEAMENLFLIRTYGKTIFAEDLGLATFANRFKAEPPRQEILRLVFSELRAQTQYLFPTQSSMRPFTRRGGVDIPFLIDFKDKTQIAITVDGNDRVSDKTTKGMTWFKKSYPRVKTVIFYRGSKAYVTQSETLCLPWTWVC